MSRITLERKRSLVCRNPGLTAAGIALFLHLPLSASDPVKPVTITAADCTAVKVGDAIPVTAIGEPVSAVRLSAPVWNEAAGALPANCSIDGEMLPVSKGPHAQPIKFRVMLPAVWRGISIQFGGGGNNGVLPALAGPPRGGLTNALTDGAATYGSDSGHNAVDNTWALDDEAIRNFAFMQMKKTHDAAMVLIRRVYGMAPRYNYYAGNSQGGREALTVAQRYPADYDGITATVPVVNFSALMIAPVQMRIQEKAIAQWVPAVKGRAVAAEFMRQCDALDGISDGIINNYRACRYLFDTSRKGAASPWAHKLCSGDVDPDPTDGTEAACLTAAQARTLEFDFSRYKFSQPYANGVTSFGMWVPTTAVAPGGERVGGPPAQASVRVSGRAADTRPGEAPPGLGRGAPARPPNPTGGGILVSNRYKGQEGAAPDAPLFSSQGILGAIGFIMRDLDANPLDYVEGGKYLARRRQISEWIDATNPDLSAFRKRGGKLLMIVGTNDTTAAPGAQLDYYQSVLDKLGRTTVDSFMRMWVIPQAGHGLEGRSYTINGKGEKVEAHEIPNQLDRMAALRSWVEQGVAPAKVERLTGKDGSIPLCSYPDYPRYTSGDATQSTSYICTAP